MTRSGDFRVLTSPVPPLVSYDEVKNWFGLTDAIPLPQVAGVMSAISQLIRNYTGRILTHGEYVETFQLVSDEKAARFTREFPIDRATIGVEVLSYEQGSIRVPPGMFSDVTYLAGYEMIPADLTFVFMELLRMQMGIMEIPGFGVTTTAPVEKAVSVGSLKVEYAVSANTSFAKLATAGGLSAEALVPWHGTLDAYRSFRTLVSS